MDGFTFRQAYYDTIKKIKKRPEQAALTLAITEFVFEGKEPEGLSEVCEIAFEAFRHTLEKSIHNGKNARRNIQSIENRKGIDRESNENRFENDLKTNDNRNEIDSESILKNDSETNEKRFENDFTEKEVFPTKERSKENIPLQEKEQKEKKGTYVPQKEKSDESGELSPLSAEGSGLNESVGKKRKEFIQDNVLEYFNRVYELYPRKVNKVQARITFEHKFRGLSEEEARMRANQIYKTLKAQNQMWSEESGGSGREYDKIPYFSSWLNANVEDSPKFKRGKG